MDKQEFEQAFAGAGLKARIEVVCEGCGQVYSRIKEKVRDNINAHGTYTCRPCATKKRHAAKPVTAETRKKIGQRLRGKPKSEAARRRMAEAKKAYFASPEGQLARARLSQLAAQGHVENRFEASKRKGLFPSEVNGCLLPYDSSYELRAYWLLEQDDEVVRYEPHLGYTWEGRSRCRDLLITYRNGVKKAVEIKPEDRLNEPENVQQLADSKAHAEANGWIYEEWTEATFGLTYQEIRDWADEYRRNLEGIDYPGYRREANRRKAKRYYDRNIVEDKVEVFCSFCQETHRPLRLTYERNVARNGTYVCERRGGQMSGSKPKPHLVKDNPYAASGMKQCTGKCQRILPFDSFSPDKSRRDGYSSRCKECRADSSRERYRKKGQAEDLPNAEAELGGGET